MLFISHNLAIVRYVSDSVAVMYGGQIVVAGPTVQALAELAPAVLAMHHAVKAALDPYGILNPGKVIERAASADHRYHSSQIQASST